MTDAANLDITTEELLSKARGNATAFVLTTIAYLEERGMAVEDYVDFFGRRFAMGWEELRAWPVVDVARSVASNAVSVGCTWARSREMRHAPKYSSPVGPMRRSSPASSGWSRTPATPCGTASTPSWSVWT